jgi:cytochrome c oxidase assembly protein subunit 15
MIVPFLHPDIVANSPYSAGQIVVEWAHRGLAMIIGILIFATIGAAWSGQREKPIVAKSATLAGLLLPVQVILGGVTVTQALQPIIVTAHLGVALLILLSITVATLMAWYSE